MTPGKQVKVAEPKGRPMLTWVGKKPPRHVIAYPSQLVEAFDPTGSFAQTNADPMWRAWPAAYPKGGLLFHGDNKEVLAHLLANGFRGKVKLVYIDPPFDSGADYVRKVQLRGVVREATINGTAYSLGEQIQYTDIWSNDNYLQFMYERLLLLKELMAADGSIWLHCDWHRSHHLRCLMDEVFGVSAFKNEVTWQRTDPHNDAKSRIGWIHDSLLWYTKGEEYTYNWGAVVEPLSEAALKEYSLMRLWNGQVVRYDPKLEGTGRRFKLDDCTYKGNHPTRRFEWRGARPSDKRVWPYDLDGMEAALARGEVYLRDSASGAARCRVSYLDERDGQVLQTIWSSCGRMKGGVQYPTEKPHALLSRIVQGWSNPNDIVLDCFVGSGTAAVVAQGLGRRWIACDINNGAIQITSKRVQQVILEQSMNRVAGGDAPPSSANGLVVYRVNNYDLQVQHNEAVNLACEHVGVERSRSDGFFDGTLGSRLVKVIPFHHALTLLDLEELTRELQSRPNEDRGIVLICLGKELAAEAWVEDWNRLRTGNNTINRIEVFELRTDPKYGGFVAHEAATADVSIIRDADVITVQITDFVSPTIIKRLDMDYTLLKTRITDWRSMVDCVMIDTHYDGQVFRVVLSDVPASKDELVHGVYQVDAPKADSTVAVKIVDMLGEEVIVTRRVSADLGSSLFDLHTPGHTDRATGASVQGHEHGS